MAEPMTSTVSVLVMDWTRTGALPPTVTTLVPHLTSPCRLWRTCACATWMGFFMASTQGLVVWVGKWGRFCCKAIGVTGVITTFSVNGCGLPILPSTGTVPAVGVAGTDTGMGGVSKTGTVEATVGPGDPATPSALLGPVGDGKAWGNPVSSETGQTNQINTITKNTGFIMRYPFSIFWFYNFNFNFLFYFNFNLNF